MASRILRRLPLLPTRSSQRFPISLARTISSNASSTNPIRVTLFPGEGVGPEITESVKQVISTAEVPIEWEEHFIAEEVDTKTQSLLTWESLESVRRNGVGLKGPMDVPFGMGEENYQRREELRVQPYNFTFRKELGLFANVKLCNSMFGYKARSKDDINLVTIRENPKPILPKEKNEDFPGDLEEGKKELFDEDYMMKRSMLVVESAFEYAKLQGRHKISTIHVPNILRKVDGIFLECCRDVAKNYPEIEYEQMILEKCQIMFLKNPRAFDVILTPNYHSWFINEYCQDLLGGFGLTPSCNIGEGGIALAEAVHGCAHDIAGKNVANPTALVLSAVMLLEHLKLNEKADQIRNAVVKTITQGKYKTADLGGTCTTTDFTKAICDNL